MYDFITIGSALEDVSFIVNNPEAHGNALFSFYEDRKIEIQNAEFNLGGGGMNTAIVLSKLNLAVAPMINIGADARGEIVKTELYKRGISTELVQVDKDSHTGVSVVLITKKKGRHVLFVARGANEKLSIYVKGIKKLKPRWVYITSLHGDWQQDLEKIFLLKRKMGFKIAFNPGQNQLSQNPDFIRSIMPDIDCLLINRKEVSLLLGSKSSDMEFLSKKMHKCGAKMVVITEGEAGANVYDGKTLFHVDIVDTKSVDSTGTGDAFGATFIGAFYKHEDIEKALKYAIIQSSKVTEEIGAQHGLVNEKVLNKISKKVKISKYENI